MGTAGCYSYSVVPVGGAPAGVNVRARISAAEAERLESILGRGDRQLEGRVIETGAESLTLAVPAATAATGVSSGPIHQRITLPRSEIFEMEVRRLNGRRTGAIAVGLSLLAAYVAVQQFGHNNERPGGSEKGGIER